MSKSARKYRVLNILVMIYLIAAFSWWAILLFRKNETNHQLQKQLHKYEQSQTAVEIEEAYERQKKMILGEGLVFGLSIFFGLILINRAFRSEINLNQRLNDFLLSVTHELKTPIATLKMANQTLINENLSEAQKLKLLETSKEETNRLEAQVNNILAAAQIEKKYIYNFEKFDLTKLITVIIKRYNKAYPLRTIEFTSKPQEITLQADQESIFRVIDNLLSNALKYSDQDKHVEIQVSKNNTAVLIQVLDSGRGIPIEYKNKIWNKFFRIENEETRETQGTGLGLWIVKEIIIRHKGKITFENNSPTGSIFKVELPL